MAEDLALIHKRAIEFLETIVCTEGEDKGVILIDHKATFDWSEEYKCQVYRNEYFTPLGDALIALHEILTKGETENERKVNT